MFVDIKLYLAPTAPFWSRKVKFLLLKIGGRGKFKDGGGGGGGGSGKLLEVDPLCLPCELKLLLFALHQQNKMLQAHLGSLYSQLINSYSD